MRDRDIVRALGFVALYSAYLEESIEELIEVISPFQDVPNDLHKWQASRQIKWCKEIVSSLDDVQFSELLQLLDCAAVLFEKRHTFIHGRIYADPNYPFLLRPGRKNQSERYIDPDELYDFSDELFNLSTRLPAGFCLSLTSVIGGKLA